MPYKDPAVRKAKANEYSRKWAAAHRDRAYVATLNWRKNNPEKFKAIQDRYYANNVEARKESQRKAHAKRNQREDVKAAKRAWAKSHPDYVKSYAKVYSEDHKEKYREYKKHYYVEHREVLKAKSKERLKTSPRKSTPEQLEAKRIYNAEYRLKNKERVAACEKAKASAGNHRRKQLLRQAKGKAKPDQILARWMFYGMRCAYCHTPIESFQKCHMDHVIPLARGGSKWPSNLVPACKKCNLRKGVKRWLPRWLQKEAA